jgi:hypothetical protein
MSPRDTDAEAGVNASSAAAETAAAPVSDAPSISPEQPGSLSPSQPAPTRASASEVAKPIEMPKIIELPKPVEAAMKAAEAMRATDAGKAPVAPLEESMAPQAPANEDAEEPRTSRFAMLAASVAFAGALGAMAGALGTSVFARPQPATEGPGAVVDLTAVRDSIASLRSEMVAIKSSVESSQRSANAQFAKFTERLERIDRAQPASATQLKQALEAIDRLEKRAQAQGGDVTGSVRPQQAAAAPASQSAAEAARQRIVEGWTLRHVSQGVAVIQGRRFGAIEVEAGDIVPGVGRIESIRRQDGRWVVLTSNGMITPPTPR